MTTDPADDLWAAWAPDGHTIAFASSRAGAPGIYLRDLDDAAGGDVLLDTGTLAATTPTFSPDGSWIAFQGQVSGESQTSIYKVPVAGGGVPTKLSEAVALNSAPVWSADGTIYFVSSRGGTYEIYSMTSIGWDETVVTYSSRILGNPALSQDRTILAWSRTEAGVAAIRLLYLETTGERSLPAGGDIDPAFAPGAAQLAVSTSRHGSRTIVLLDLSTGAEVGRVTHGAGGDVAPAFRRAP